MGKEDSCQDETLNDLFNKCVKLHEYLRNSSEPSQSSQFQSQVSLCIKMLEDLSNRVSLAGIFSSNESLDELSTSSVKFLLLPSMLGDLTSKRSGTERLEVIRLADIYYRDFLRRCEEYDACEAKAPESRDTPGDDGAVANSHQPATSASTVPADMRNLASMSRQREARILRHRRQKQLQKELAQLQTAVSQLDPPDELVRQYYCTLIQRAGDQAVDELASLQLEKPILEHMAQLKLNAAAGGAQETPPPRPPPLRPVLLTRTRLQAQVLGAGYSSLPTMSVEDFYRQRVADGIFPDPTANIGQSAAHASNRQSAANQIEDAISAEDAEAAENERAEETDAVGYLARARGWDEYRDDHQRGEGNRYNRS